MKVNTCLSTSTVKTFPQVNGHLIKDGGKNSYTLNNKNVNTTTPNAYTLN